MLNQIDTKTALIVSPGFIVLSTFHLSSLIEYLSSYSSENTNISSKFVVTTLTVAFNFMGRFENFYI
jgi:hypothetical protein